MLPWVSSEEVFKRVSIRRAILAVQSAFESGLDPSNDLRRSIRNVANGQILMMPSQSSQFVGIKIASVAPANPSIGKERIQGVYLMMDATTLSPLILIDGSALTALRTAAVSAAIADYLAPDKVDHLVVFGAGTQARKHIDAMLAIRSIGRITIVARHKDRATALASLVASNGLDARVGGSDEVRDAQIIICATTARAPLFDGNLVLDDSLSVAVGSHEADARELDSELIGRAQLVVEDNKTALSEAGDLIIPIHEGVIEATSLIPMRDIIVGITPVDPLRPRVFKSSGMAWEDLVIASEIVRAR